MSEDVGSRSKLTKKLKISALKSKSTKDTKKRVQRTRRDSEDGGMRNLGSPKMRKRIYAEQGLSGEVVSNGNVERTKRKYLSRKRQSLEEDDVVKAKGSNVSPRSMWGSIKLEDATYETKVSSRKAKKAVESVRVSRVTRAKGIDKESFEVGGGDAGLLKKRTKSKSDSSKGLDPSNKKSQDVSLLNSAKKKVKDKKNLGEDLEVQVEQPKKKKRVIRIDPHDISNKRLDEGIVNIESKKEKKKDLEEKAGISKNAQFRAIEPSPSILSYVEDNLLGRRRLIELRRAGYNTELSAPLDNIPFSTSSERERIEETIFRNKLTFFAAAKASSSFPPPELPEIAFAGRSNVGKSSLLNALTRQWGVVRTSDKPGLTQTINFFKLGSKLSLVDLPGYGFAYAKEEVKDAWEELVKEYVSTRVGLKRKREIFNSLFSGDLTFAFELCKLPEIIHAFEFDDVYYVLYRAKTKYQIVLTKTDIVFPIDVARRAMQIEESLKAHKSVVQPLMMVSSKSGAGIRSLRTVLAKISRLAKI
ncbi:GTP-binding ribosome biogenesis protein [Parasponia andersonii]|uniref:GTP-binding ribosome biogenesis protein n=1 Tax=Parasponia andersonii TaxID=3476 RepID=A0A2P5AZF6_PARAD|nr:GTP-binding ribosome biogenesis protein [Parasponia andersonii]